MKKPFLLLLLILTSVIYSQTDKLKISGVVFDSKGESIPGVNVTSEDQSIQTDIEGKYSINVKSSKSILKYTSIGFDAQIVVVGKNKVINITLAESKNVLDEVVVIGYGTQKRSNVTGSVSKYKNEKMDEIAVSRLDQALQGKIAGVQVQNVSSEAGADAVISIRGISSVNAGASPLVVVDGQPNPDGLASINMADVASVEVLKDAASAAIYGSRGASGVILITTKSGKTDKVKYAFKYSSGFKTAYNRYPLLNTSQYTQLLYNERDIRATDPYFINPDPITHIIPVNNILYLGSNTKVKSIQAAYIVEQTLLGGKGYNYQDEVLQTAGFKNIQLSASGGNKNMRYFVSSGYQGDEGVMLKSNYEKFNFRSKIDIDLSKKVKLSFNLNPSYTTKESPSENFTNFWRYASWLPAVHTAATIDFIKNNPTPNSFSPLLKIGDYAHPRHFIGLTYSSFMPDGSQFFMPDGLSFGTNGVAVATPNNSAQNNPMASLLSHDINAKTYGLQSGASLSVNLLPGLDFKTMASLYMKYDTKLDWSNRDADGDGLENKGVYYNNSYIDLLSENTLNYKKEFENQSLDVVLGYTAQKTKGTKTQTTGLSYASDDVQTLNSAVFVDKLGTFGSQNQVGLLSYLGRVNYGFKGKYLLSASFRSDGSSYFGPGHKWGSFPAASVGWVANKESFLNKVGWLNKLAFRGSYGVSGNNRILDYGFSNLLSPANYSFGSETGTQTPGLATTSTIIANPDITWESTYQTNVGLDLSLFNNRFNITADVYQSMTDKLLLQQATMAFTGVPLAWNNIGSLDNKGYEFELSTTNIKSKNFKWATSVNIAHTENKIRELGNEKYLRNQGERTELYQNKVGDPLVEFFGYKTDGVWLSQIQIDAAKASGLTSTLPSLFKPGGLKLVDVNGHHIDSVTGAFVLDEGKPDNIIDIYDRTVIGNPYPDFTWGVTNTFNIKSVDFSFSWQGVQGGQLINGDPNYSDVRSRNTNYNRNRWLSPEHIGDGKTPYEDIGFNWLLTDYVVESASYFALREVNIGYTLPSDFCKQIGLSSLRLYSSANNLYIHSAAGYRGINPEGRSNSGPYASSLVAGYQRGSFPASKTIVLGIDINF